MKSSLLERLEMFNAAPFTIQRLCELLTDPRKQYSRIDKFMRALEKNILGTLWNFNFTYKINCSIVFSSYIPLFLILNSCKHS